MIRGKYHLLCLMIVLFYKKIRQCRACARDIYLSPSLMAIDSSPKLSPGLSNIPVIGFNSSR